MSGKVRDVVRTVHFGGSARPVRLGGAPSTSAPAGRAGGGDEASIKAADYLTPPVARAGRSAVGPKKYRGQRFEGMLLGGYLQLLLHSPIAGVRYLTSRGCSWSLSIARLSRWWGSLPAAQPWQRANSPGDFTSPTAACSKRRVSRAARVGCSRQFAHRVSRVRAKTARYRSLTQNLVSVPRNPGAGRARGAWRAPERAASLLL